MAGNKNVKIGRELSYKDKSDEELREIVTSSLSLLEQTCKNGEWDSCYFVGGNLVRKSKPSDVLIVQKCCVISFNDYNVVKTILIGIQFVPRSFLRKAAS